MWRFLGRVSPEKGLDHAIEIAIRAGKKLKIAAKVDRADRDYFQEKIKPLLNHPLIEFVGRLGSPRRPNFWGMRLRCCSRSIGPNLSDW
jgi:glycosyltransferase involved in cell wall biosynthesis